MARPEQLVVEKVHSRDEWVGKDRDTGADENMTAYELTFQGENRTWKTFPKLKDDPKFEPGLVVKGWKNWEKGTFGFAEKVGFSGNGDQAQSQPQSQGSSRGGSQQQFQTSDPTRESIERQTAAKAAAEMAASLDSTNAEVVATNFDEFFQRVYAKINPDSATPF